MKTRQNSLACKSESAFENSERNKLPNLLLENKDEESDTDSSVYSGLDEENGSSSSDECPGSSEDDDIIGNESTDFRKEEEENIINEKSSSDEYPGSSEGDDMVGNESTDFRKEEEENTMFSNSESKVLADADKHQNKSVVDEYAEDTSDEEDLRNTVGNIPMKWYDDFPHIGYDVEGKKIMKPATKDEIDKFLSKIDDPNYWRTVKNKMTGEDVFLTDEDVEIIQRIQGGRYPTGEDQFQPFEDFFTYKTMKHSVTNHPPHKRSFTPSKIEKEKVSRLVYAIKMGWIKPRAPKKKEDEFYMLWENDEVEESKRLQHYIPAPKRKLPGHEESYNPPPEYLFTEDEKQKWKEQEPYERKLDFIPQKYSSLRQVPAYSLYAKEWFERCLDLYLCPRKRKMRVNVDPNELIPKLPKPKDLQPFPTVLSIVYTGHSALVRCICVETTGQFMASASDDNTIKVWEVLTGRCLKTIEIGSTVKSMSWCPNQALCMLLAVVGEKLYVINPKIGDKIIVSNTDALLNTLPENMDSKIVSWTSPNVEQRELGIRIIITHAKEIKQVIWHAKGDYFACALSDVGHRSIVIHQLSKFRSQVPFEKLKGNVQCILFHPLRPFFFVATLRHVRVYNLMKQEVSQVLIGNCKWISSMAIHPQGDNILIGCYDSKVSWFDLDLSSKPYKTLKHHKKAVRQVSFHRRYPLFASTSDDGSVIICHGMVYSDLLQNPTIIPVKLLKGHGLSLDCCFHPLRPWIFSTSDSTIRLYS